MTKDLSKEREQRKANSNIDEEFERMIRMMNTTLSKVKDELSPMNVDVKSLPPLVFFCYAPRTGSTMLSQFLTRTRAFSYISNFTARFWETPYLALTLEKKLGIRDAVQSELEVVGSRYGVTSHIAEPHEFGFFWNKLLTSDQNHWIDPAKLTLNEVQNFVNEVNALRSVDDKPFFFKNGIAGYNTAFLKDTFPDAKFIVIERDPLYVAQSIYIAREELYNDPKVWWSIRPKNFDELVAKSNNEFEEIAWQIEQVYTDIRSGLKGAENRTMTVSYEDFCEAPKQTLRNVMDFTFATETNAFIKEIPDRIETRARVKVNATIFEGLKKATDSICTKH